MAGGKVSTLAKPQLRGLLQKQIKVNLCIGIVLSIVVGAAQKFLYNDARKQKYAEFFKTYDIEEEFETMRKKGLFDSC